MILIDTTVWIDFLNGIDTLQVKQLTEAIKREEVCITGIVLTEVLQGIKDNNEFDKVKNLFADIPIYEVRGIYTYLHAAQIYRKCRKEGYTVRKTIDCIIAAIVLENNLALLHNDRDFDLIAKCTDLKVVKD